MEQKIMNATNSDIVSLGNGLFRDPRAQSLWRQEPRNMATTTLVSSGTILGGYYGHQLAFINWLGASNTGAMWVIYLEPSTSENWLGYEAKHFPTAHAVPADDSPWSSHIASLRKDMGLPVSELVQALQVSRQTYYDWLSGELPNLNNQKRIADLAVIASAWQALNLGDMRRYWQLPEPSAAASLREYLTGSNLAIEDFHLIIGRLGLGRRLLPARASKPRLNPGKQSRPNYGVRKAWHAEPDDKD
jgi:transcriptional regulator with XRE-family HTH domain